MATIKADLSNTLIYVEGKIISPTELNAIPPAKISSVSILKGESLDDIIYDEIEILKQRGFLKAGDVVVNTGSTPVNLHLPTNIVKITTVE